MEFKDYYQLMGVKRDATHDEIKREYRKLARKYHPDVSKEPDAEARFKQVGEAWEVLQDPEKRAAYDQLGADHRAGEEFRPPPDWNQGFEFHESDDAEEAAHFSDFFRSVFGRGEGSDQGWRTTGAGDDSFGGGGFAMRGTDTYAKVAIDVEDAYAGNPRLLTIRHAEPGPDGHPVWRNRTLNVSIPVGIREGQHIRLAGQGSPGSGNAKAGDLYLEVSFNPHRLYRAEGADVYLDLPIAPWEAALGASVQAPTPSGQVELTVPAGSVSGRKLRLKGRGLPGKSPGNLYVVLRIVLPPDLSEKAKAAWRELAKAAPFNPREGLK